MGLLKFAFIRNLAEMKFYCTLSLILFSTCLPVLLTGNALIAQNGPTSTLIIYAGNSQTVCHPGDSVTLGSAPTATGGVAPYTYAWTPSANMNNNTLANPQVSILASVEKFYLVVTDFSGNKATDSVTIYIDSINYVSAGASQSICGGKSIQLGSPLNPKSFTYSWITGDSLTCANCPQPYSRPTSAITYTMNVTDPLTGCSSAPTVTLTPYGPPLSTTSPVYLTQGHNTNLNASGAYRYQWWPVYLMYYSNTATPEVEIEQTYTYYVAGYDGNGCASYDSVEVIVKSDTDLVFYNTFTPNGDGINDTWYIGNIWLYPNNDLYIYNRYGKQVYYTHKYVNNWEGKCQDVDLPAATYYYVLNTNTGKVYRGSVTIIRVE